MRGRHWYFGQHCAPKTGPVKHIFIRIFQRSYQRWKHTSRTPAGPRPGPGFQAHAPFVGVDTASGNIGTRAQTTQTTRIPSQVYSECIASHPSDSRIPPPLSKYPSCSPMLLQESISMGAHKISATFPHFPPLAQPSPPSADPE